ncbi:hypothetical protein VE04_09959 [Pseudogymnoascus sp. 24MN13]|nr:hypothetical protein VE04_09959 [Pseudogymnoascus sp. 24MN13]
MALKRKTPLFPFFFTQARQSLVLQIDGHGCLCSTSPSSLPVRKAERRLASSTSNPAAQEAIRPAQQKTTATMFPAMMDPKSGNVFATWHLFTRSEKKNMMIYIAGIMVYKFGLEVFVGSFISLASNRYDYAARVGGYTPVTFGRIGLLQGLNQAFQCFGAILVAPLVKRWETRIVLSVAILVFALFTTVILIVDAATGGTFKPAGTPAGDFSYYGDFNTDGMIPVYCVTGVVYGMVELIRRVIPRDIVRSDVQKLRRLDAAVHIFYEVTGTAGAFTTALVLIPHLGNNMAIIVSPFCFARGRVHLVAQLDRPEHPTTPPNCAPSTAPPTSPSSPNPPNSSLSPSAREHAFSSRSRTCTWHLPSCSLALDAQRYLENNIAPLLAQRYLHNSAWAQLIVGGSNFGELLGALFVFLFTNLVTTPMPWLRLDACGLLIVWYLAFWHPTPGQVGQAWMVAATFIPISFGWAAGDISRSADRQAMLHRQEHERKDVSALVTVMAFLYSTYIVTYSICSPLLGTYIDKVSAANGGDVHEAIKYVGGVQFTIIACTVFAATFIPRGSFAFNPDMLEGEDLQAYRARDMEERPPPVKQEKVVKTKEEKREQTESMKGLKVGDDDWFMDL